MLLNTIFNLNLLLNAHNTIQSKPSYNINSEVLKYRVICITLPLFLVFIVTCFKPEIQSHELLLYEEECSFLTELFL